MATTELKYFEKLNIEVMTIGKIKQLIQNDIILTINAHNKGYDVEKQAWRIIGPAGVGKTAICSQLVKELSETTGKTFEMIMIKAPLLSRDDMILPFPVIDDGKKSFEMLYSNFIPDTNTNSDYGIFVIDENSRGDHDLQQLLWGIQNEYKIHMKEFPKGWFVISTDNPPDSEYQIDEMIDAAGIRRNNHIYTEVSAIDFLNYAIEVKFHPYVIQFIQTKPETIYDFVAQKKGSVFSNPASWERVSDHLWKYELSGDNGIKDNLNLVSSAISGLLNVNMTQLFINFIQNQDDINPRDIIFNYKQVKPLITKLLNKKDNAAISSLIVSYVTYLSTSLPEITDANLKNVSEFLVSMPADSSAVLISHIDNFDRKSKEFKYMTNLQISLMKFDSYKELFYDNLVNLSKEK